MAGRDRAAFAEFVAARSTSLHRAAYLMVGDVGLAQDLVQEALTKTYVAWPRLRDPANAEAYTRKAITTTAISWFRRKSWNAEKATGAVPDRDCSRTTVLPDGKDGDLYAVGTGEFIGFSAGAPSLSVEVSPQ